MAMLAPENTEIRKAKLFMNGRSQAVRLPKEFRFEGKEVIISKEGSRVVLEPVKVRSWPPGFLESLDTDADEFLNMKRPDQGDMPEIPAIFDDE